MVKLLALAALTAGVALVTGCGDSSSEPAPSVSLPPPGRLFGFNDETFAFTGGNEPRLDQGVTAARELADARAAGANSARIVVSWWAAEPRPGFFDARYVSRLRRFTDALERSGGRVLLVLGAPPPWASARPGAARATIVPSQQIIRAYARFAGFVARTWPRAAAIETWNEPNTTYFWNPRAPQPGLFVRMHRAAAAQIRSVAPRTKIVLGGLLAVPADTPQIMAPQTFLRRAYAAGLRPSDYDALGLHIYPSQSEGNVGSLDGGYFAAALRSFELGHARRDPNARVWVTETGLSTTGPQAVSATEQARGLPDLLGTLAARPEVDALYVHTLYEPRASPAVSAERGFGVMRAAGPGAGRPKPAFCALRRRARRPAPFAGCSQDS